LIRGTANYWKPTAAKKTFSSIDYYLWGKIFRFINRLHPNKSMKWLKKTYFPTYNDGMHVNNWILTGPKEGNHLIQMAWTPIRRHIMIKSNYSPYDNSKREYFNNRRSTN